MKAVTPDTSPVASPVAAVPIAAQLLPWLRQRSQDPFRWGWRDCFLLACDAAEQITGRDPGADLRGAYATAREAARLLRKLGGWQVLGQRFGPPVPLAQAPVGAIVLLHASVCAGAMAGGGGLGVLLAGSIVAQGSLGLVAVPRQAAQLAWEMR